MGHESGGREGRKRESLVVEKLRRVFPGRGTVMSSPKKEGGRRESNRILCLHCLSAQLRQPRGPLAANTTGLDSALLGLENFFTTLGDGVNRPYLMYSISCDKQANNTTSQPSSTHFAIALLGVVGKSVLGRYLAVCYQSSLPIFSGIEFCGLWLIFPCAVMGKEALSRL